jgi:hypothetical protein
MRTGFYDSNLIVRNNKISGEPKVGLSIGIWINDGTKDSIYEGNEIWDCEYGFELWHYPPGHRYLSGGPSLPCSNITLKNNYIHDISGINIAAGDQDDRDSYIEINNYYTPTPTPVPSSTILVTATPVATPGVQATATPAASSGNPIVDFILGVSGALVAPFEGILRQDQVSSGGSTFDGAAVAALIGWTVLEVVILAIVRVARSKSA